MRELKVIKCIMDEVMPQWLMEKVAAMYNEMMPLRRSCEGRKRKYACSILSILKAATPHTKLCSSLVLTWLLSSDSKHCLWCDLYAITSTFSPLVPRGVLPCDVISREHQVRWKFPNVKVSDNKTVVPGNVTSLPSSVFWWHYSEWQRDA